MERRHLSIVGTSHVLVRVRLGTSSERDMTWVKKIWY